jgi:sulfate transport system ATP-binding protein
MILECKDLCKDYYIGKTPVPVLKHISFQVEPGEYIAIMGPSGSGKTTLMNMIGCLDTPTAGELTLCDHSVSGLSDNKLADLRNRTLGFVFQNAELLSGLTALDNVALPLLYRGVHKRERREKAAAMLEKVGLGDRMNFKPNQLSGGQRQRVAFARALAPNPRLLLLDEPFAAIDAKVRQELRTWLRGIINQVGITSIFVTHDQEEAIEVADQIIVTNSGQVEQVGSPLELYQSPATPFVAKFIGSSMIVEDYDRFKFFCPKKNGSYAILRPEFIQVYKLDEPAQFSQSAEEGVVEDLIFRGGSVEVKVRIHDLLLSSNRGINEAPVQIGERVNVFIYRLYVVNGTQVTELTNKSLRSESVII